jgi:probable rRNA maturation factor
MRRAESERAIPVVRKMPQPVASAPPRRRARPIARARRPAGRRRTTSRPGASAKPARRARAAAPSIDIILGSPQWQAQRGVRALLRRTIRAAAVLAAVRGGELAVVLADDAAIRALNRRWRGKDSPTNVLSFPSGGPRCRGPVKSLGDIVIAFETAVREARAGELPLPHHVAHLAVHGFLHLVGYDHATDPEAEVMEALETAVLARLGMPDPYAKRDAETDC